MQKQVPVKILQWTLDWHSIKKGTRPCHCFSTFFYYSQIKKIQNYCDDSMFDRKLNITRYKLLSIIHGRQTCGEAVPNETK